MTTAELDDQGTQPATAGGDAFADLIRPHLGPMTATARRIVGSNDRAWDAVQDALVAFWAEWEVGVPAHVGGWLRRAVVHRSLQIRRADARRRRHETLAGRAEACDRLDPARVSADHDLTAAVDAAVAALPADAQVVYRLNAVERLGYADIAARLDVPLGTVQSRLSRARATLRKSLRETVSEPDCWHCRAKGRPEGSCPDAHHTFDN